MITGLVSIIIPSFNRAGLLQQAVASALSQEYPHKQVIVVDDGSTDATADRVAEFPEVVYLRQENRGPSTARNRGLAAAEGEFLLFQDSDDLLDASLLVRALCALSDPAVGFVLANFRVIDHGGNVTVSDYHNSRNWHGLFGSPGETLACAAFRKWLFRHSHLCGGVLFRRSVIKHHWNPRIRVGEDRLFMLQNLTNSGCSVRVLHDPLWSYRVHDNNTYQSNARMDRLAYRDNLSLEEILRTVPNLSGEEVACIARARARNYFDWAYYCQLNRQRRRARLLCLRSFRMCPSLRTAKALFANGVSSILDF